MERPTRSTRASLAPSASDFTAAVSAAIAAGAAKGQATAFVVGRIDQTVVGPGASTAAIEEQVIEVLRRNLRHGDVLWHEADVASILLPSTLRDQAVQVASRLGASVRQHSFSAARGERPRASVTLSLGVAAAPVHGSKVEQLVLAARSACDHVTASGGDSMAAAPLSPGQSPDRRLELERFIGRVEELARLGRALDDAVAGSPRVVAVHGEPGSGRATLVRQLEPEVRLRGGSLVVARARSGGVEMPYAIWAQLIGAIRRLPDAPSASRAWNELSRLDPGIKGTAEQGGSKFSLLEEISEFVRLSARSRPLVVVLEEMQWADAASWDALDHLLTGLERERLLVCLTTRDDPRQSDADRRKSLERFTNYEDIRLSRLTRDEVKRWLESAMQRQEIGREPLAFVYRHTEGNPLFIAELMRLMLEEGSIRHTGLRWEWSPVSELRMPNGFDEIIRRRLSVFDPGVRDVLCAASVIGRRFDLELLLAAADAPAASVHAAIQEAVARGMLVPNAERGGGGHAFVHERVTEALTASCPPDRVTLMHARVADAMRGRPTAVVDAALHYDAANRAADAYAFALKAADQAERLYTYDVAGEFLRIAARNAATPGDLAEVRERMAYIAETLGRFDETEELCDLAIEWFSGRGDRLRALTLRRIRERARRELGQPARIILEALRGLDEEAKALGSDRERVEILTMESQTYARLAEPQLAEQLAEECVRIAEHVGDTALRAAALNRLGITVRSRSPIKAREYFNSALELFQRLGDVRGQARCHNNLGVTHAEVHADQGRDSLAMAMSLARSAGMPDLAGTAALNLGVLMQKGGDHDRARELYDEAMSLFAAVKNSELQLYALYNLANVERDSGNFSVGAELYDATSSLAQRIGQSDVEIGAMAGEGLCLLALGKLEAVRIHSAEIEHRLASATGWFQGREVVDAFRVRSAAADGRVSQAMEIYEAARQDAAAVDLYSVHWLTATVADLFMADYRDQMQEIIRQYRAEATALGFTDLVRIFESLQEMPRESVQS